MRDAIEDLYAPAIRAIGGYYPSDLPEGMTPQSWYVSMDAQAETVTAGDFDEKYAQPAAAGLIQKAERLQLTHFASLSVQDRPAARHQGSARVHRRDRAFVVHALGWRTTAITERPKAPLLDAVKVIRTVAARMSRAIQARLSEIATELEQIQHDSENGRREGPRARA
jgi:hypothetical protein